MSETEGRASDTMAARLEQMVSDGIGDSCGDADVATVLAQIMRQELSRSGGKSIRQILTGPFTSISANTLSRCNLNVMSSGQDRVVVEASEWRPQWAEIPEDDSITQAALAGQARRDFESCTADPFLRHLNFRTYRCVGQREAIRAALTMPNGATLLVSLPTGSGKSLLAQLPCVLDPHSLTVVVVPTTALCVDQERALRSTTEGKPGGVEHDTAFYSGDERRRKRIRDRIIKGEQRIVFASPEAICGPLSHLLHTAAQKHGQGRLRWLVIDEAHIVEQWGSSFRPLFQVVAGLRTALVRAGSDDPLRTILMSATLTPSSTVGLKRLFGTPGPFGAVQSVQLRPEPSYWFVKCDDIEQQRARIEEAVLNLPKPLILYTTKIAQAKEWRDQLRKVGLRRIGFVIGETTAESRRKVIFGLRDGDIEVVVANSAFGLGVDAVVRSVVHACVPENLDRYYQEVGRGGRDGRASISMVIYTPQDLQDARRMNEETVIGREKGLKRWRRLFALKEDLGDAHYQVRLNVGHRRNALNLRWDNHTINLLARAGVIALDWKSPSFPEEEATSEEWIKFREEQKGRRILRILDNAPLDERTWDIKVEPERRRISNANKRGFALMDKVLRGDRCVAAVVAELYGGTDGFSLPNGAARVAKGCGGCPVCRRDGNSPWSIAMPVPSQPWIVDRSAITPALGRLMQHGSTAIFYSSSEVDPGWRGILEAMNWLVRAGLRFVAAPSDFLDVWTPPDLQDPVFVANSWPISDPPSVPALVVHPPGEPAPADLYGLAGQSGHPSVLLFEERVLSSTGRRLRDVINAPSLSFREFQEGYLT